MPLFLTQFAIRAQTFLPVVAENGIADSLRSAYNFIVRIMLVFVSWLAFPANFISTALGYEYQNGVFVSSGNASMVRNAFEACQIYGICLALIFLVISLGEIMMEDVKTPQLMIKPALNFILSLGVITMCDQIVLYIYKIGEELFNDMKQSTFDSMEIYQYSTGSWLIDLFCNLIPLLAALLALIFAMLNMFVPLVSRLLEIICRFIFIPLAAGMTADNGLKGPAMRYFKKFAALILQGVGYLAFVIAFSAIIPAITADGMISDLDAMLQEAELNAIEAVENNKTVDTLLKKIGVVPSGYLPISRILNADKQTTTITYTYRIKDGQSYYNDKSRSQYEKNTTAVCCVSDDGTYKENGKTYKIKPLNRCIRKVTIDKSWYDNETGRLKDGAEIKVSYYYKQESAEKRTDDFATFVLSIVFSLGLCFALKSGISKVTEITNDVFGT